MVIHFCASLPCAARQRLGDGRLMALRIAHEHALRQASPTPQAAALAELAHGCRRCPFHLGLRDFGCGGVIEHPISAAAERWLLRRLPDDLDTPAARGLLIGLHHLKSESAEVDRLRALRRHYELRRPLRRRWGGLLQGRTVVTSSQMLQLALPGRRPAAAAGAAAGHRAGLPRRTGCTPGGCGHGLWSAGRCLGASAQALRIHRGRGGAARRRRFHRAMSTTDRAPACPPPGP